jgi:hypothetical protein
MIRHVVLFRWKPDFPHDARADWMARVRDLPRAIPTIRSLSVGTDVVRAGRSWDAAIVADFDRVEDVEGYAVHPEHLPLIAISGTGAEVVASVDFEITDASD